MVTTGQSVLVKNQASGTQNGIYLITDQGSASAPFILTRRGDADNSIAGQVKAGDAVYVLSGSVNQSQGFILTSEGTGTSNAIVFGTDSLSFSQFTGTSSLTAGSGLSINLNELNIGTASNTRIVVNANDIDLATVTLSNGTGADTTTFVSNISVDSYGRITGKETSNVSFAAYAPLASPSLTGAPTAPTANASENSTVIATTAFAKTAASDAVSTHAGTSTDIHGIANTALLVTLGGTQTLANKTLTSPTITGVSPTITLDGDISGSGSLTNLGNVTITATIAANSVALGTDTTGNYIATIAGTADQVTVTGSGSESAAVTLSLPQNIATTSSPTFAGATLDAVQVGITATNEIDTSTGNLVIDSFGGTVTVDDNLVVSGNLTVSGTTTSVNTETLTIDDNIIVLNNNEASAPSQNAGVEIERGTSTNVLLRWNETNDKWELTNDGTNYGNIVTTADTGTVTSTMILDGTIVNACISNSAAIAYSKLSLANSIVNADISSAAAIDQSKIADTTINAQTASYTLVLTDKNKLIEVSNASATTLTIPADNSVNFPTGASIAVLQTGAGQITLAGAAGVTLNATPGAKLRAQWSSATLIKRAANTWVALGDLSS